MNTTEKNQMIAEFMGVSPRVSPLDGHKFYSAIDLDNVGLPDEPTREEELAFHKEWNWLMPVFKKIHELPLKEVEGVYKIHAFNVKIDGIYCSVSHGRTGEIIVEDDSGDMFDNLYCVIVEFIKWYNDQKDIEDNMAHDFDREPDF